MAPRPPIDLNNFEQQLIIAAVATMFDQGKTVHEILDLTKEIVINVWHGLQQEEKE